MTPLMLSLIFWRYAWATVPFPSGPARGALLKLHEMGMIRITDTNNWTYDLTARAQKFVREVTTMEIA